MYLIKLFIVFVLCVPTASAIPYGPCMAEWSYIESLKEEANYLREHIVELSDPNYDTQENADVYTWDNLYIDPPVRQINDVEEEDNE